NKGVTPKQIKESVTQLKKIVTAGKWKFVGDITAGGALEYLGALRKDGRSAQTYNHYLKATKQFTRWLVRNRRTLTDPLAHLSKLNVSSDRRHACVALAPDEFSRLVQAAQVGSAIETIPGPDRAMIYVLAA